MRLTDEQISLLKNKLKSLSSEAKIYLFGSRVDDTKKGGDIDLLIISDILTKKDLRQIRLAFFEKFGEQKLDLLLDKSELKNPFSKYIFEKAVLL